MGYIKLLELIFFARSKQSLMKKFLPWWIKLRIWVSSISFFALVDLFMSKINTLTCHNNLPNIKSVIKLWCFCACSRKNDIKYVAHFYSSFPRGICEGVLEKTEGISNGFSRYEGCGVCQADENFFFNLSYVIGNKNQEKIILMECYTKWWWHKEKNEICAD